MQAKYFWVLVCSIDSSFMLRHDKVQITILGVGWIFLGYFAENQLFIQCVWEKSNQLEETRALNIPIKSSSSSNLYAISNILMQDMEISIFWSAEHDLTKSLFPSEKGFCGLLLPLHTRRDIVLLSPEMGSESFHLSPGAQTHTPYALAQLYKDFSCLLSPHLYTLSTTPRRSWMLKQFKFFLLFSFPFSYFINFSKIKVCM